MIDKNEKQKKLGDYPEILTPVEVADILKVSETEILTMLESGDIPGKRIGSIWRVMKTKLLSVFEDTEQQTVGDLTGNRYKIGELVRQNLTELFENARIPPDIIEKLKTAAYSKAEFGISFPLLRDYDPKLSTDISRQVSDEKGYARYWKDPFAGKYLVTSQWYERHRAKFLRWVRKFE